ncbi:hypothetical protein BC834DRAFT_457492 [Gloeopeniophorella convolvens]|nr:hypothetical protein BC834DRAFT_457492 [Gloeopeniophorella convolvens]
MIRDCILQGITPVLPLEKVDAVVESLINKCLDHDPDMRPTIKDIKASEWFADIDWNSIRREYGPDITITLPTPDMITDIPTDMPSTIIAPDLSLSVSEAETEGELSLPWTHPYLSALTLDTPSPGTSTLASGHSAVLSHADRGSFVAARRVSFTPVRPRNPSPPSLPSSAGGGDALARWSHRHQDESFLPRLSEADGATRIGLGVCVSEFGTFLPEHAIALAPASAEDDDGSDDDYDGSDSDTSSPDMTLQDALALPIPLLVTPRGGANTPDVRAGGTLRERIPARLLRWRSSGLRDSLTASHGVPNSALPEPTWHGLDADPFRSSPPPASAPPLSGLPDDADADAGEGMGMGGASPQRLDATFRWSTVSLDIGAAPQPRALQVRRAALATLSQRLRERGRALLRHSRSSMLLPRPRLPTPPRVLRADEGEKEELTLGRGVRRIGLGIGYSVSPPAPPAVPGYALREDAVPAGCYAGLGRRRKSVGQLRLQLQVRAAAGRGESASFLGRSEEGEGEEGVLVLGHPVSGAVALAASGSI